MGIKRTFASNLLFLRQREGLTLEEISKELGVKISRYSHWERGIVMPQKPELLVKLSEAYKVSIDDLLRKVMVNEQ